MLMVTILSSILSSSSSHITKPISSSSLHHILQVSLHRNPTVSQLCYLHQNLIRQCTQ